MPYSQYMHFIIETGLFTVCTERMRCILINWNILVETRKEFNLHPNTTPTFCHTHPQSITKAHDKFSETSPSILFVFRLLQDTLDPALSQYMASGPRLVILVMCLTSVSTEPRDSLAQHIKQCKCNNLNVTIISFSMRKKQFAYPKRTITGLIFLAQYTHRRSVLSS